jgi:hypothetical protein
MEAIKAFFGTAWGQVALALIVPIGWGLLSAWFFDHMRARRGRRAVVKPRP